jgi:protein O-mannosyl-transferase
VKAASELLPAASRSLPAWIPATTVGLLAVGVYANSLSNGFITDDQFQILNNPLVTGTQSLVSAFGNGVWAFLGYRGNYYRPLQFIIYGLLYRAFGPRALPFHVLMVLLHALNTLLVYQLVRRLLGGKRVAVPWVAAALFAVHPIHTEAVNWIAALPDVLVTTFVLVGLSAFAAQDAAPNGWQLAAHVCLYLAALFTKETGVMMLPIYLAYHWLVERGLFGRGRGWAIYAGMTAAFAAYLALRIHSLGGLGHPQGFHQLTAMQFAMSAAVLAAHYFAAFIWPLPLNFYHVFYATTELSGELLLALLALTAVAWAVWRFRRREPLVVFGIFWIAAAVAPALNIPGVGQNVFTERYLYLPSVGFALLTGLIWMHFAADRQNWAWLAAGAILLLSSVQSVARNSDWKNDFTLLHVTLRQSPESGYLHNLMAGVWVHRDEYQKALREARLAALLEPGAPIYRKNLGNILLGIDPAGAVREFTAFVTLQPELAEAHFDLGLAYRASGDNAHAAEEFRRASTIEPRYRQAVPAQPVH